MPEQAEAQKRPGGGGPGRGPEALKGPRRSPQTQKKLGRGAKTSKNLQEARGPNKLKKNPEAQKMPEEAAGPDWEEFQKPIKKPQDKRRQNLKKSPRKKSPGPKRPRRDIENGAKARKRLGKGPEACQKGPEPENGRTRKRPEVLEGPRSPQRIQNTARKCWDEVQKPEQARGPEKAGKRRLRSRKKPRRGLRHEKTQKRLRGQKRLGRGEARRNPMARTGWEEFQKPTKSPQSQKRFGRGPERGPKPRRSWDQAPKLRKSLEKARGPRKGAEKAGGPKMLSQES